jgi:hypothetical protein
VAQEFLNRSDVVVGLKQVRDQGMPEGVTAGVFHHPGLAEILSFQ